MPTPYVTIHKGSYPFLSVKSKVLALCLSLFCFSTGIQNINAQDLDSKVLEKSKGLIIFLPERGVSSKLDFYQEAKPPRGIIKPFILNDGSLFEIEDSLILENVELTSLIPENALQDKDTVLAKAQEKLAALKEKYPKFTDDWNLLAKTQDKEKALASKGYVKQKNRWISPMEWELLQKSSAEPAAKANTRLVAKDGKTFNNARLSRVDGTVLIITHESGIAKIPKSNLPAKVEPPDAKLEEAITKILATEDAPAAPAPAPATEPSAATPAPTTPAAPTT